MAQSRLFRKKSLAKIMLDAESGFYDGEHAASLKKVLRVRDLVALGIAAIVGAGIFSTIGNAAFKGGPAVSLLFVFTAVACAFSALCYAEFAGKVPVAGSAYTYAYVSFGEVVAWIIGWDLLLEYAIGNIVVAISWSDYLTGLVNSLGKASGFRLPDWLTMDYVTALKHFDEAQPFAIHGKSIPDNLLSGYLAWRDAPALGSLRLICDLPALFIIALITYIVYRGISESRRATNTMVILKMGVIALVLGAGAAYVNPDNWNPFAPNGLGGVMQGVSAVFFAYIGFDAISTTAEECRDPQRDLPRGIFGSLIICTILYVLISLTLTGMIPYHQLNVGDPLAFVFSKVGLHWIGWIVAFSALIAMASVLLVFQMGQPRIWMSMSRDGLLPKKFSQVHPKFRTPSFSTIFTGFVVAVPTFFMNQAELVDLTSIGTLFAFVLVCGGVLLMPKETGEKKGFRVPYISGRYVLPVLILVGLAVAYSMAGKEGYDAFFRKFATGEGLAQNFPMLLFMLVTVGLTAASITRKLSLIPVLGLISCFYLMTELGPANWVRFLVWLLVGLVIYFMYGYRKSTLNFANKKTS